MLTYKNVLVAHRFVGDFGVLKDAAKALGYEFILWNGKIYRACGVETFYTKGYSIMKYIGSKARHAKKLLPIILANRTEGQWYVNCCRRC